MSLNPTGNDYGWNYSKPDKEGYSTSLTGTVVAIQEVQKRDFTMDGRPGAPKFWPEGNPMMNIRLGLATPDGSLKAFTFQPAGKEAKAGKKKSIHMDLFALTGNTDMTNLLGKTITIWTEEPPAGFKYGQGNPRPWYCRLENVGPYALSQSLPYEFQVPELLCDNAVSGGQVQPVATGVAPQNIQNPAPVAAQPTTPQQVVTQPVTQPVVTQPAVDPVIAQAAAQPSVPLPTEPAAPAGMDPAVAAAMATLGATNIQPVASDPVQTDIYEEGIPF